MNQQLNSLKSPAKESLVDGNIRGIYFSMYAKPFARKEILHEAQFFHKAFNRLKKKGYVQIAERNTCV